MALNVKPLGDRILVEPVEEKEVKKGGIIIPDTAKEKPMESLVVALGTGKTDDNGKKVPFEIKKGDRVLVSKYGGTEIKLDGKEYKILRSEEHTSELQSQSNLVCRLLLEKKKHHRGPSHLVPDDRGDARRAQRVHAPDDVVTEQRPRAVAIAFQPPIQSEAQRSECLSLHT